MSRGLDPVHARHADVEQDHVGLETRAHFERFAAVGGLACDHDVVEFLEQAAQSLARRRFVVDDQHAHRFRVGWVWLAWAGRHFPPPRPAPVTSSRRLCGSEHQREAQPDPVVLADSTHLDGGPAWKHQFQALPDVVERHAVAGRAPHGRAGETGFQTSIVISVPSTWPSTVTVPPSGSGSMPWPIAFSSSGCSSRLGTIARGGSSPTSQRTREPVAEPQLLDALVDARNFQFLAQRDLGPRVVQADTEEVGEVLDRLLRARRVRARERRDRVQAVEQEVRADARLQRPNPRPRLELDAAAPLECDVEVAQRDRPDDRGDGEVRQQERPVSLGKEAGCDAEPRGPQATEPVDALRHDRHRAHDDGECPQRGCPQRQARRASGAPCRAARRRAGWSRAGRRTPAPARSGIRPGRSAAPARARRPRGPRPARSRAPCALRRNPAGRRCARLRREPVPAGVRAHPGRANKASFRRKIVEMSSSPCPCSISLR